LGRGGLILGILDGFQIGDRHQRHHGFAGSGQNNTLLARLGPSDRVGECGVCR